LNFKVFKLQSKQKSYIPFLHHKINILAAKRGNTKKNVSFWVFDPATPPITTNIAYGPYLTIF
jgi:hypothetical protein